VRRPVLAGLALLLVVLGAPAPAPAQPTDADVYVAEAILAVQDKQWDKALDLLRPVLARQPDHVEALYYTGVAYMGKRQPDLAVPVLARARHNAPREGAIGLQLGLAHIALEQYERAQPILEEVFAREPQLDSLGYYVGFLRYRQARHQEALAALRAGRTSDPAVADLTRLYTGLALQRLGLPAEAERELAQIGELRPASPLTAPAERLKSAIATSRESARRFRAQVRAGAFYDDNAPTVPDRAGNDPLVSALRDRPRETTGELLGVTLEYDWLRSASWFGTAAFSFLGTHNNDLPSFDIQDYTGVLRIGRAFTALDRLMQAGLTYAYDYRCWTTTSSCSARPSRPISRSPRAPATSPRSRPAWSSRSTTRSGDCRRPSPRMPSTTSPGSCISCGSSAIATSSRRDTSSTSTTRTGATMPISGTGSCWEASTRCPGATSA
jgi:tetratricopeptide (TPR) repeat protein